MTPTSRWMAGALLACAATSAIAGSETPPEGPPWRRSLVEAQAEALRRRVPIFVYLTKTH